MPCVELIYELRGTLRKKMRIQMRMCLLSFSLVVEVEEVIRE